MSGTDSETIGESWEVIGGLACQAGTSELIFKLQGSHWCVSVCHGGTVIPKTYCHFTPLKTVLRTLSQM